jgi:4-diphosphocytidyl-2C-methyl-D-erythritol kinase
MKAYFSDAVDAADHPEMRPAFREKYKAMAAIPVMSGPGKTIAFIEKEQKAAKK